ncbi:glutamine synthetase [Shewanella surugensis]|uniref:Glutamine synthetase n=1 Tax=Shewanella surugensis TaxID=212020 RepID=A0ABT0LA06_9GAMM|nr:glutamine synthetase [Shewanella surugensis]MCL1124389.1 glutamine synthetase [Shewanella surugensis]
MTKEQNKALGGINPLPSRLQESLDAFKSNAVLQDALGQALFETIIAIRLEEFALFMKSTPAEIIAATCWQQ